MARVLFAWELGGGFGHAGPLRAVADRLSADGHEPVFALRDVVTPAPLFRDRRYPVFQAPFWPKPFALRGRTHALSSYSDLLALSGYGQAADLAAMVAAWDTMIDQVRPDLVVLDNAPTLALAVYDRMPAIFTGYGFTLPPAHDGRFPILRDETPLLMAESQLLRNVESVQHGRSATVPETLTALFRGRFRALTCVRELDPYIARRDPELGPLEPMPVLTPLPAEAVLFAYLGGEFRNLDSVVQALSLLRCKVRAFLRDDAAMHASFLASRGVQVFRDAPALATVVPQSTWVLSMAGHTTAHAALMGGRGQIVAPTHLETSMTAERLIKLGVAREYDPRGEPHEIADAIAGIVADEGTLEAAASAAAAIADRHLGSGLERLIAACREALA